MPVERLFWFLFLLLLLSSHSLSGQAPKIPIEFDEDGTVVDGFQYYVLEPETTYELHVTMDTTALIRGALKSIGKDIGKVLKNLEESDDTHLQDWLGRTHFETAKSDLEAVRDALIHEQPIVQLRALPTTIVFDHASLLDFEGLDFGKSVKGSVKIRCGKFDSESSTTSRKLIFTNETGNWTGGACVTFTTGSCLDNDVEVVLNAIDLEKEFRRRFYNNQVPPVIRGTNLSLQNIQIEYGTLLDWQNTYSGVIARLPSVDAVWSPNVQGELLGLVNTGFPGSVKPNLYLQTDITIPNSVAHWILNTIWLDPETGPRLNPLTFVDEDDLPKTDPAPQVSSDYAQYRTKLIDDLKATGNIVTEGRMNYRLVDSLLRGEDEKYLLRKFKAKQDSLKKANAILRKRFARTTTQLHNLTLLVPDLPAKGHRVVRIEAEGLTRKDSLPRAFPNRDSLYFVVTNMAGTLNAMPKPNSVPIKDKSGAVARVELIGKVASSAVASKSALTGFTTLLVDILSKTDIRTESELNVARDNTLTINNQDANRNIAARIGRAGITPLPQPLLNDNRFRLGLTRAITDELRLDSAYTELEVDPINTVERALNQALSANDSTNIILQELLDSTLRLISIATQRLLLEQANQQKQRIDAALALFESPITRTPPPDPVKALSKPGKVPKYKNAIFFQANDGNAQQHDLTLSLVDTEGKRQIGRRFRYKTSPGHRLSGSIGPSITFDKVLVVEADDETGDVTTESVERRFGAAAGLHIHFGRMVNTNDDFLGSSKLDPRSYTSRWSAYIGANLRRPLYHPQLGLGVDLWPGIKLVAGAQFNRRNYYEVVNEVIVRDDYTYRPTGFFTIALDPAGLASLIGLF